MMKKILISLLVIALLIVLIVLGLKIARKKLNAQFPLSVDVIAKMSIKEILESTRIKDLSAQNAKMNDMSIKYNSGQ